ncbi:MAG: translational GTPase TypA [bacterium]
MALQTAEHLRNICIIAHVDHGKTTLVDHLLRQGGTFRDNQEVEERVMDSMDLERERGITIMAKNTAVKYGEKKINIVDTPGHADFGGEVERIMGMVNGAILLVDGAEGPLPQTRFVLQKALQQNLRIILVINKVDRPECEGGERIKEVLNQTFDLFVDLGASDEQADFPIIYACARQGWCTTEMDEIPSLISGERKGSLKPMFDTILSTVEPPKVDLEAPFRMLVSNLSYNDFVGQLGVGRVFSGTVRKNQPSVRRGVNEADQPLDENFVATKIYTYDGLKQVEVDELQAGDIGLVAGCPNYQIGDTITSTKEVPIIPRVAVEPPTLAMIFSINTSPLSGQEGDAIQSRKLRDRLVKETRMNVALRFEETDQPEQFRVLGRGELQFAVLIEQMRREGSEFMVARPAVLYKTDANGNRLEPIELAVLDLPETYSSDVTRLFQERRGILQKYENQSIASTGGTSRVRLEIEVPTRGLLGMRSKYLTATRGEGLFSSQLLGYKEHRGDIIHRINGALISDRDGETVEYALFSIEERGTLFVGPGVKVYEGMLIGEHAKENDLNVNCCREKKLTNVRASGAEILVTLRTLRKMSLEQYIEWIEDDEWIEVTPENIRIRKKVLKQNLRSVKRERD